MAVSLMPMPNDHINAPNDPAIIDSMNPGNLAYLGDSVFEVLVRQRIVHNTNHAKLNKKALAYVTAKAQAVMYHKLVELATPDELAIMKRGRNFATKAPKSASVSEYKHATGLEALFGYLFLTGQIARTNELFDALYTYTNEEKTHEPKK